MIYAICSIYEGVNLVPHFIRHYLDRLKVDQILLSVRDPALQPMILPYCSDRVKMLVTPAEFFSDSDKAEVEERMLADVQPDDWVMHLDLDEFQEYPAPLSEIIAEMEKHRDWALRGWIVDRVALDGRLNPIYTDIDIFNQFPISCAATELLLGAWTQKIMICRRRVRLKGGVRHETANAKYDRVPVGRGNQYLVHHFKWTAGLESRIKARLATGKFSWKYGVECGILLTHLAKFGRLNLSVFDPKALDGRMITIVPSRGRPANVHRLIRGCRTTIMGSDLLIALDDDDSTLPEYQAVLALHNLPWLKSSIGPRIRMGPTLNREAKRLAPEYDVIGFMGDDHYPKTERWDSRIFHSMPGITYGNDLLQGERLPTAAWMSSEIIRELGWMAPPDLVHLYLDDFWRDFGREIGRLTYLKGVIIEHLHPNAKKGDWDAGYTEVNSKETFNKDAETYRKYKETRLKTDVFRIKSLLSGIKSRIK